MPHAKRELTTSWTLIATAPKVCMLQLRGANAAIIGIGAAAPAAGADLFVLAHNGGVGLTLPDLSGAAQNVYARAKTENTAIAAFSVT